MQPGKFTFLAEQVSHHPPISAFEIKGNVGYKRWGSVGLKTSFSGGALSFSNTHREYFEFVNYKERFEYLGPMKSIHNLIMGSPYLEATGKS